MRLLLIAAHPTNLTIRHSPQYTTTAKGGGFLRYIKTLPETSFKNRILLSEIESTSYTDDVNGFDTIVSLKLSSGKTRYIRFRKLENQFGAFIEAISQQSSLHKLAY